jgi:predicted DNA-binding ribbon-helix-helix protein
VPRSSSQNIDRTIVQKRSIVLNGHKTSVSLEQDYWDAVIMIARARKTTIAELVGSIDAERTNANLSSALRLFVLGEAQAGRLGPRPAEPLKDRRHVRWNLMALLKR